MRLGLAIRPWVGRVRGVGMVFARWVAEMMLVMSLARSHVWSFPMHESPAAPSLQTPASQRPCRAQRPWPRAWSARRTILGTTRGAPGAVASANPMGVSGGRHVALPDMIGRPGLRDALSRRGIESIQIPCMAFERTRAPLAQLLARQEWQYIVVTAPESASILLQAWVEAAKPDLNVACVGRETRQMLSEGGLRPLDFASTTGKELVATLPDAKGAASAGQVLLPVSVKATQGVPKSEKRNRAGVACQ